jgi:biopolymer transport protein ExbD
MTPMVDLGFLLVTFFTMTTQFAPTDLVNIVTPHATAENKLPESNNAVVVISKGGLVFFRLDGRKNLRALGEKLSAKYNLCLTEAELTEFSRQSGFGMPLSGMQQFLNLTSEQQKNTSMPGIPIQIGQNELIDWLIYSRVVNPDARMVIKADKGTAYPVIKRVMDTLQNCNINRFNLVTETERKQNI